MFCYIESQHNLSLTMSSFGSAAGSGYGTCFYKRTKLGKECEPNKEATFLLDQTALPNSQHNLCHCHNYQYLISDCYVLENSKHKSLQTVRRKSALCLPHLYHFCPYSALKRRKELQEGSMRQQASPRRCLSTLAPRLLGPTTSAKVQAAAGTSDTYPEPWGIASLHTAASPVAAPSHNQQKCSKGQQRPRPESVHCRISTPSAPSLTQISCPSSYQGFSNSGEKSSIFTTIVGRPRI